MIDIVLLAVIAVSALLGVMRGFIGTVVGTLSWVLALWAAVKFGGEAASWFSKGSTPSMAEYLAGYAIVFAAVLIAVAVLGMLIRTAVHAVRLSGLDRMMGLALGMLRGLILVCLAVLVMRYTPLASAPAWRQSVALPVLLPVVDWMHAQMPSSPFTQMDLGWQAATGDNVAPELANAFSASIKQAATRALGQQRAEAPVDESGVPATAAPTNIEPAQTRAETESSVRDGSQHGQTWPPSQ